MKTSSIVFLLMTVVVTGCVSKKEMTAKERAAFLAGQRQGAAMEANKSSVQIVGNVRNPSIPWTEDLTLTRALIEADYQGQGDPNQIVIFRTGQPPRYISAKQLLNGFDLPLLAGDTVEVRQ